jgi:DNA-binding winged helix-turn-helix (wHTH) protein/Tol biopolymer transport system component
MLDWVVDPTSNELRQGETVVRLQPLHMSLLLRLLRDAGRVVTREQLLTEVWQRRLVNDEVLSRAVADLRHALADHPRTPRYIETLPKVGYRLIAPVASLAAEVPARPSDMSVVLAHPPQARPAASSEPPSGVQPTRARAHRLASLVGVGLLLTATAGAWWGLPRPTAADVDAAVLTARLAQAVAWASDPVYEVAPRFSPDGGAVAYAEVSDSGESRIVVRGLDSGERRTFTRAGATVTSPVFAGRERILYWWQAAERCGIAQFDARLEQHREIVECAASPASRFDLSADGQWLVYAGTEHAEGARGLRLRHQVTGATRALTQPAPEQGDDLYPRFSPDGRRILFFRGGPSHRQAWVVEVATDAAPRPLQGVIGQAWGGCFLPQGQAVLVATDLNGFRALSRVDLMSGRIDAVGARGARFPDVAKNGAIILEGASFEANLWRLNPGVPAAPPVVLAPSTRYTSQPALSPDGAWLAFASNREAGDALYVLAPGGEVRRVASSPTYRYMRPRWADPETLLALRNPLGARRATVHEAVRISIATGQQTVLHHLGQNVSVVLATGRGAEVIVGMHEGDASRLYLADLDERRPPRRLPVPPASDVRVAGERLAFTQPRLPGLTVCDLAGTRCQHLALPLDERNRGEWALSASAVIYRDPVPPTRLMRHDLATGHVTVLTDWVPTAIADPLAVSADERTLVVSRSGLISIDLMLAPP